MVLRVAAQEAVLEAAVLGAALGAAVMEAVMEAAVMEVVLEAAVLGVAATGPAVREFCNLPSGSNLKAIGQVLFVPRRRRFAAVVTRCGLT